MSCCDDPTCPRRLHFAEAKAFTEHPPAGPDCPHGPRPPHPAPVEPLPVAHHVPAYRAVHPHGTAQRVHVCITAYATGLEVDTEDVTTMGGPERRITTGTWVELTTKHGERFRVPADHLVVLA